MWPLPGRNCVSFYRLGLIFGWHKITQEEKWIGRLCSKPVSEKRIRVYFENQHYTICFLSGLGHWLLVLKGKNKLINHSARSAARLLSLDQLFVFFLRKGIRPMVPKETCSQRPSNGCLEMLDLASHRLAERLSFLRWSLTEDSTSGPKVRVTFPILTFCLEAEGWQRPKEESLFLKECRVSFCKLPWLSNFLRLRMVLYRDLVKGAVLDPLEKRLGEDLHPVKLGARHLFS